MYIHKWSFQQTHRNRNYIRGVIHHAAVIFTVDFSHLLGDLGADWTAYFRHLSVWNTCVFRSFLERHPIFIFFVNLETTQWPFSEMVQGQTSSVSVGLLNLFWCNTTIQQTHPWHPFAFCFIKKSHRPCLSWGAKYMYLDSLSPSPRSGRMVFGLAYKPI